MLWLLAACGGPELSATVLHSEPDAVVVKHEGFGDTLTPGIDRFAVSEKVPAGSLITASLDLEARALTDVEVTGGSSLPNDVGMHPIKARVVRVRQPDNIVLDHERIPGVMGAMIMPFAVRDPSVIAGLQKGDHVQGRLFVADHRYHLVELDKTASGELTLRTDVPALVPGDVMPRTEIPVEDGSTVVVGVGQDRPTVLSWIFTRCPDPNFCPMVIARMQALQPQIQGKARIVLLTLDPEFDTLSVLTNHAGAAGAEADTWRFGRLDGEAMQVMALRSAMEVTKEDGRISHRLRLLVLGADGRLIERYDDNGWPMERVVEQLLTGAPKADPGTAGTLTP